MHGCFAVRGLVLWALSDEPEPAAEIWEPAICADVDEYCIAFAQNLPPPTSPFVMCHYFNIPQISKEIKKIGNRQ